LKKINVLHIIKSLGRGGAEMLLPATVHHHNKEQFDFHCIYFLPWKDQMVKALEAEGVKVTCMPANNNLQMLLRIPAVRRYIKQHSIDVVHAHLPWAGVVAARAGKAAGVPVIYTEHNNVNRYHAVTKWLNKNSYNHYTKVLAVSSDAKNAATAQFQHVPCSIETLYNGVDTSFFELKEGMKEKSKEQLQLPSGKLIVTNVAVFRTQKRLDRWLQIAQQVLKQTTEVQFVLIGDGPLRESIQQQAATLGIKDAVLMPGLQKEMYNWFAATDVFLMSSDWEGLPIALLEAMSMGCVPVVSDAGGIPEVVTEECGVVYEKENIERAAAAILSLEKDRRALKAYSFNSRKRIEEAYSLRRMVGELERVYGELVERGVRS
jgi:glycosyltransferase involved in cell wall biosynthesis